MKDDSFDELIRRARTAWSAQDYRTVVDLARRLLDRRRSDFESLMLMANAVGATRTAREEVPYLARAVKVQPKNPDLRVHVGQRLIIAGQLRQALAQVEAALALVPSHPSATAVKATVYERQNRYDRARRTLAPLVAGASTPPEIAALQLRVLIHEGELTDAIELGRSVAAAGLPESIPLRAMLFALGKALELDGAYEEAFRAAVSANAMLARGYDAEGARRGFDALIEAFSAERMAALPRSGVTSEAPIFIVGLPRTGSTLIEQIIASHPAAAGTGEANLVQTLIDDMPAAIGSVHPYPACARALDGAHADALGRTLLGELTALAPRASHITNKYLPAYRHLGLINVLLPRARVIHCRRRPLDTCLSCFMERLTPAQAPYATRLEDLGRHHRQYARLMEHWRTVLDIPLFELDYEVMVADQEETTRRLLEFCGLPWDERCLRFHEEKRSEGTLSFDQVRRPIYRSSVGRAERFGPLLDPLRTALGTET